MFTAMASIINLSMQAHTGKSRTITRMQKRKTKAGTADAVVREPRQRVDATDFPSLRELWGCLRSADIQENGPGYHVIEHDWIPSIDAIGLWH